MQNNDRIADQLNFQTIAEVMQMNEQDSVIDFDAHHSVSLTIYRKSGKPLVTIEITPNSQNLTKGENQ